MQLLLVSIVLSLFAGCSGDLLLTLDENTIRAESAPGAPVPPTLQEIYARSLWVVGGLSGGTITTVVSEVDVFDPVTRTWYPDVTRVPTPVSFAGVAGFRGRLYVIGGFDLTGTVRNLVQIYDIATNQWSAGTLMPSALANINAIALDGFIYVLNGTTGNAALGWAPVNQTLRYDISANSWVARTPPGAVRSNLTGFLFGGSIYSVGARTGAAAVATMNDAYIPIVSGTDALSAGVTETPPLTPKIGMVGDVHVTPSGVAHMIIAGGVTVMTGTTGNWAFQGTTTYTATNMVESLVYPFAAGAVWQPLAQPLPAPIGHGSGLIANNVFHHFGGTLTGTTVAPPAGQNLVFLSDLSAFPSNMWVTGPSMPRGRYGHSVVRIRSN